MQGMAKGLRSGVISALKVRDRHFGRVTVLLRVTKSVGMLCSRNLTAKTG